MYENLKKSFSPLLAKMVFGNKIIYGLAIFKSLFVVVINRIFFNRRISYWYCLGKNDSGEIYSVKFGDRQLYLKFFDLIWELYKPERESDIEYGHYISKGDVVCDVGAHIGTHTIRMLESLAGDGFVVAVEPDRGNFGLLNLNMSQYNGSSIMLLNNALAKEDGVMKMYHQERSDYGSMFYSLARKSDKFDLVSTISFKSLFEKINSDVIHLMKVDIEGAEEELFLSEVDIWKDQKIKVVVLDTHGGVDYNRITTHLCSYGYKYEFRCNRYYFYLDGNEKFSSTRMNQ
jgi:FkbM family methyltransferase